MANQNRVPCQLHIPHKEWAGPKEQRNYLVMEEQVQRIWMAGVLNNRPAIERTGGNGNSDRFDLHLPNKEWSGSEKELANYEAIEQWWALAMSKVQNGNQPVSKAASGRYDLEIPFKEWSGDPLEHQNYLEIERWASYWIRNCYTGGGCL